MYLRRKLYKINKICYYIIYVYLIMPITLEEFTIIEQNIKEEIKPLKPDISILQKKYLPLNNNIINIIKKNTKILEELKIFNQHKIIGIEQEIGKIIKNHYRETKRKDAEIIYLPLKIIHNKKGDILTKIDYAFVAKYDNKIDIIIIEAKHHITLKKFIKK